MSAPPFFFLALAEAVRRKHGSPLETHALATVNGGATYVTHDGKRVIASREPPTP